MSSHGADSDFQQLLQQKDLGDQPVTYCLESCIGQEAIFTPAIRHQAMRSPQRLQWCMTDQIEINSITEQKVLEPAQLPTNKKALRAKCV